MTVLSRVIADFGLPLDESSRTLGGAREEHNN